MAELRFNPLLGTWTMVSANRQNRPHMPRDYCPFCPSHGNIAPYDVTRYDNDFPILMPDPPEADPVGSDFYQTMPSAGKCEVILYSPEHEARLHELPRPHIRKLVDLWAERSVELARDPRVKNVYPFENRGEEVGVTMPHPHGQIYAYSFVPLKLHVELENCRRYHQDTGECMLCRMNREETIFGRRVIFENEGFIIYIPFFTDYPFGAFITAKRHISGFSRMNSMEKDCLAEALKVLTGAFDHVFDRLFPYMMAVHQEVVNSPEYGNVNDYFHFHIEFYPPLRAADRIKYYASSEMGMWAAANVAPVEQKAQELRAAKIRWMDQTQDSLFIPELVKEFMISYGGTEKPAVYSAPGRVNIIGEHTDYNGGHVLPASISLENRLVIRPRADGKIIMRSLQYPEVLVSDISAPIIKSTECPWADYPLGVMKVLKDKGIILKNGFEALYHSGIPAGAGLSSSAAIEVVTALALSQMAGVSLSGTEVALLSREAENSFVGVQCGIMDQFASANGIAGHALYLDCSTLEHSAVPLSLGGYTLVIMNSNKKRGLLESKYDERVMECRKAMDILGPLTGKKELCHITPGEWDLYSEKIIDPVVRSRARHAVSEEARVQEAVRVLERGDITALGLLLNESHQSLSRDYEVAGIELDALISACISRPECAGARMTGAGFGGCAIALVKSEDLKEFKKSVSAEYKKQTGLIVLFYDCTIPGGARRIA